MKLKLLLSLVLMMGILYVGYEYFRTQKYIEIGVGIAEKAKAYEQNGVGDLPTRVLFVDEEKSVAGYLGNEFENFDIKNIAVNGHKTEDVVSLLEDMSVEGGWDYLVLQIGGNDIVRRVDVQEIEVNLRNILERVDGVAEKVVVFHGGNVGTSKLFPWFVRPYYTYRTQEVRKMYLRVVDDFDGVTYVDMFRNKSEDPFYLEPEKYYSEDNFHPSGAGYRDWYDLMRDVVDFEG
jgi:lysophospholipase L1-like esterase